MQNATRDGHDIIVSLAHTWIVNLPLDKLLWGKYRQMDVSVNLEDMYSDIYDIDFGKNVMGGEIAVGTKMQMSPTYKQEFSARKCSGRKAMVNWGDFDIKCPNPFSRISLQNC